MIKIPLKKVKYKHLEVLQREMEMYRDHVTMNDLTKDFLNAITSLDIAINLYFVLRHKLEQGSTDKLYTISFTVSQAATILKCCYYNRFDRDEYEKNVMLQFSLELDPALKSLNQHTKIPLLTR